MRQGDAPLPKPPQGDRPSEYWMCGHGKVGTPCSSGPFPNGRCPAEGLCKPVLRANKDGVQELQCARPTCLGGPCEPGPEPDGQCGMIPTPCVPVCTALGRRRYYRRIGIAIGVGVLLIAIGGTWRREIFAPGPLAQPHALILGGALKQERCAACHPAARSGFAQWFNPDATGHAGISQSDLCMDCHHAKLERKTATLPHNLTRDQIKLVTQQVKKTLLTNPNLAARPSFFASDVECAICHREHHGSDADLTALTNNQCQSCHSVQFASFSKGHPQWTDWPYDRGGSIAFSHSTHQFNYFSKDGKAFDCRSCHEVNSQGDIARAGSFESMCASCHQQPLEIRVQEGFSLIGLPTLDGESIEAANLKLGPWPTAALGIDRIEIPEFTQALLRADKNTDQAIKVLLDPAITSLSEPPKPISLRAMVIVANELRKLLSGLAKSPADEMNLRLGSDRGQRLLGQLSAQLTQDSIRSWFGGTSGSEGSEPNKLLPNGGWYRDDLRSAIRYRGTGHADPLLKEIAELSFDATVPSHQRKLLAEISAVKACLECHPRPSHTRADSWKAIREDAGKRTFTKYSHRPHLNLPELANCTTCHEVRTPGAVDSLTTIVSLRSLDSNPNSTSDFRQLSRSACVTCHTPQAAGDNCTKCHNYHVDFVK